MPTLTRGAAQEQVKLAACRARRYWTRRELAERSGVSPATIYNIEKGVVSVPRLAVVKKLAEALEVDPVEVDEFREVMAAD